MNIQFLKVVQLVKQDNDRLAFLNEDLAEKKLAFEKAKCEKADFFLDLETRYSPNTSNVSIQSRIQDGFLIFFRESTE